MISFPVAKFTTNLKSSAVRPAAEQLVNSDCKCIIEAKNVVYILLKVLCQFYVAQ